VDAVGDCRFEHKGNKLMITVPGTGHSLEHHKAPSLLRDVVGDFAVVVRVGGNFRPDDPKGFGRSRQAGLLLADKLKFTAGQFGYDLSDSAVRPPTWIPVLCIGTIPSPEKAHFTDRLPVWLRLERRGNVARLSFAHDGKKWQQFKDPQRIKLPRRLKVGIVAEATAEGTFKAVFDQFKLTPLGEAGAER
jgi:hypothetical protein